MKTTDKAVVGIQYVVGDATSPIGDGHKIIVHCCNDIGAWGAGFVVALSKKWPGPEHAYLNTPYRRHLGSVGFVEVGSEITVANLIGQHGARQCASDRHQASDPLRRNQRRPRRGSKIRFLLRRRLQRPHAPHRAGLAGGDWAIIERLIDESLVARGVDVTVYDLP